MLHKRLSLVQALSFVALQVFGALRNGNITTTLLDDLAVRVNTAVAPVQGRMAASRAFQHSRLLVN